MIEKMSCAVKGFKDVILGDQKVIYPENKGKMAPISKSFGE